MTTIAKKRGVSRVRGVVTIPKAIRHQYDGRKKMTRWFPSASKEDQVAAFLWEQEIKQKLSRQESLASSDGITLAEWHDRYLDHAKANLASKTYYEKYYAFEIFVDVFGDSTRVEEVDPESFEKYMRKQAKLRSGNSTNKDRKNLSAGWNWAKKNIKHWPLNEAHPNPFLVVPRRKEVRNERYVPSVKDFWAVYDKSEGQDRVILCLAYYLAARRGEIWRLEWQQDVDLVNKRIRLATRKTADGSWKHNWLPMADDVYKALLWQWENVRTKAHDFVFWSQADNQHMGNPFVSRQKWMVEMCALAEVKYFGMHSIRHRRATDLYESGFRLGQIQTLLRHESPSVTERYLKKLGLDLDNMQEVMESTSRGKVVNIGKRL